MKRINAILQKMPAILSSKVSIFIYVFLFFYLVIYALICNTVPAMHDMAPSNTTQLVMGNYTNVLSALGASIAAGAGVVTHASLKSMHTKHDAMQKTIDALHEKIDRLEGKSKDSDAS